MCSARGDHGPDRCHASTRRQGLRAAHTPHCGHRHRYEQCHPDTSHSQAPIRFSRRQTAPRSQGPFRRHVTQPPLLIVTATAHQIDKPKVRRVAARPRPRCRDRAVTSSVRDAGRTLRCATKVRRSTLRHAVATSPDRRRARGRGARRSRGERSSAPLPAHVATKIIGEVLAELD